MYWRIVGGNGAISVHYVPGPEVRPPSRGGQDDAKN